MINWHTEKRYLRDLIEWDKNPRQLSKHDAEHIKRSLEKFGVADPLVINTDNMIIGGHQRKRILQMIASAEPNYQVDVRVPDRQLTDDEVAELNIRLNKNSGNWDWDILANEFEAIELIDWGFTEEELTGLDFGEGSGDCERNILEDRFVIPPFSIFDTRQGYWQDRKNKWLAFGIEGEIGRDAFASADASGFKGSTQNRATNITVGKKPSIFDPVLCEVLYRWFMPAGGLIINPTAGESVYGLVASYLGYRYKGIELRQEQVDANRKQNDDMKLSAEWITGDGCDIYNLVGEDADFIMCCPPYADLEVYSDDPLDLSTMEYDKFINVYREIIFESVRRLKDNRFAAFTVGDIRDKSGNYRNFVSETISAFIDAGCNLYNSAVLLNRTGTVAMQVSHNFPIGRKLGKLHQNVLVFLKGDWREAVKACGTVEVEMPDDID